MSKYFERLNVGMFPLGLCVKEHSWTCQTSPLKVVGEANKIPLINKLESTRCLGYKEVVIFSWTRKELFFVKEKISKETLGPFPGWEWKRV